jgi:hypothetical protein
MMAFKELSQTVLAVDSRCLICWRMVCIEKEGWYFCSAADASLGLGLDDGCALGGTLLKLSDGAGIGRVDEPLVEAI